MFTGALAHSQMPAPKLASVNLFHQENQHIASISVADSCPKFSKQIYPSKKSAFYLRKTVEKTMDTIGNTINKNHGKKIKKHGKKKKTWKKNMEKP